MDTSRLFMTLTIILISALLTGFGIYDKLGQLFKCGFAIPISGEASRSDTQKVITIYKYMVIKKEKNPLKNEHRT